MRRSAASPRRPGDRVESIKLETIDGRTVVLPDPDRLVHLQFRRFAGCPICNTHLRSFAERSEQVAAADVHEIVLFHSEADKLRPFPDLLKFDTVADPDRTLYDAFGVRSSIRSELSFRALAAGMRGLFRRRGPLKLDVGSGILGLPADLLIAPDGTVRDAHYGKHAYDQWTVDEVLAKAAASAREA